MLKREHFDNDIREAYSVLDSNTSIEEKLRVILHAVEMVGKRTFDNAQNEIRIMKALEVQPVAHKKAEENG